MSNTIQSSSPYFCPACNAVIPSKHSGQACPRCRAELSGEVLERLRAEGMSASAYKSMSSPVRRVGWILLLAGLVLAGGAGSVYIDLGAKASRQSISAALAYGTGGFGLAAERSRELREKRDGIIPWIVVGGLLSIVGTGLAVAGGSAVSRRKCPKCAELVLAEAIKCKHCGEAL